MPSGAVQQQDGVRASGDVQGDLVDEPLHGVGIGQGRRQRCTHAARGANGAEQVGALTALVGGLDRPCAAARPLPHEAVLLAYAVRREIARPSTISFRLTVLEPDLYPLLARHAREMSSERAREVFLNAWMTSPSYLG